MVDVEYKIKVLATIFIVFSTADSQRCERGASFLTSHNTRLVCGIFRELKARYLKCQQLCEAEMVCFSTNWYTGEDGKEICELVKETKMSTGGERSSCIQHKLRSIHSQIIATKSHQRKVLADGWYQLGQSAFKHIPKQMIRDDAKKACEDQGADLAEVSDLEEKFVTALFHDKVDANRPILMVKNKTGQSECHVIELMKQQGLSRIQCKSPVEVEFICRKNF